MTRVLVIGASGDVGQGVTRIALAKGWSVVACGRNEEKLLALAQRLGMPETLHLVTGDISDEQGGISLRAKAVAAGVIDAVVVTINEPNKVRPLLDWTAHELTELLKNNLLSHFIAAKTFLPALADGGVFITIGGGTADFVIAGMGQLSIMQAAQRMMIKAIAKEHLNAKTYLRELMVASMVNGEKNRKEADPSWLTDIEIGEHVAAIIANPAKFPGPILTIKSREQIGLPS